MVGGGASVVPGIHAFNILRSTLWNFFIRHWRRGKISQQKVRACSKHSSFSLPVTMCDYYITILILNKGEYVLRWKHSSLLVPRGQLQLKKFYRISTLIRRVLPLSNENLSESCSKFHKHFTLVNYSCSWKLKSPLLACCRALLFWCSRNVLSHFVNVPF